MNAPNQGVCNAHSWSDQGPWTYCCYTQDHANAKGMWLKPQELTAYSGYGYEIAYIYYRQKLIFKNIEENFTTEIILQSTVGRKE